MTKNISITDRTFGDMKKWAVDNGIVHYSAIISKLIDDSNKLNRLKHKNGICIDCAVYDVCGGMGKPVKECTGFVK